MVSKGLANTKKDYLGQKKTQVRTLKGPARTYKDKLRH